MSAAMSRVSDTPDLDPAGLNGDRDSPTDVDVLTPIPDAAVASDAPSGSWFSRKASAAGRRIIRRPLDWIDAPWTVERIVRTLTTFLFLFVAAIITLNVV